MCVILVSNCFSPPTKGFQNNCLIKTSICQSILLKCISTPKAPIPVQFSTILYQRAPRPTVFLHAWTCCPLILCCRLLMRQTDRNNQDAPETGTFAISLYKERDPPRRPPPAHVQLRCRSICSARSISRLRNQTSRVNGDNRREENAERVEGRRGTKITRREAWGAKGDDGSANKIWR